ncbi:hypothetical protein B0T09DRAFT_321985 [Sordaria sp. MPI-SDFR-AT-0083]|nr:hypothetical protein B0T09DRAFT_321985 [Sordaria sp. MPI-SDFR-AT-0083]
MRQKSRRNRRKLPPATSNDDGRIEVHSLFPGLCRVAATTRAGRPTSWRMFKSAVLVHNPLQIGHHLVHRIRIHPHHHQFLRPTTASSAAQLAVAEQPDRLALEAPLPCSPAQIPQDNKDIDQVVSPSRATKKPVTLLLRMDRSEWRILRNITSMALACLTRTNRTQKASQRTAQVLSRIYDKLSGFYGGMEEYPSKYRALAACRTTAEIAGSAAVEAREALWEADMSYVKAQAELDFANSQADAQDQALKAKRAKHCEAARKACLEEYTKANETVLQPSGIVPSTPHPRLRKANDITREDYEWMLPAIDQILEYREWSLEKARQQAHAASVAASKMWKRSREPRTETPAMPIEQSGDERIEQPAEAEDEAAQLNHVENIRTEQRENVVLEQVKDLEQSKVPRHPKFKLDWPITNPKSTQLREALAAHYPIMLFPHKVNTTIVETVRMLLEESCYRFSLAHIPHHLAEKNWESPEVVELSTWKRTFTNTLLKDPRTVSAFKTTSVPARLCDSYVLEHLDTLGLVRNLAAHPRPLSPGALLRLFRRVRELAGLLSDRRLQQLMHQLSSTIIRVLGDLRVRRIKNLEEGCTHELYRQIVADKAAVERIRNSQAPASQEHQAACVMFEKEIQRLADALPVSIQADEEAMFKAGLKPLIEMVDEMAAQVKKRNAQMQQKLKAKRKLSADKMLDEVQLLLDKHARRMRGGSFPFSKLSERERELLLEGSPLPLAEQEGPQEKPESHEHQEDTQPHEQQGKTTELKDLSPARRAKIRNALAQGLQKEERKREREQAKADANAEITSTPTEEELARSGSGPSLPEEEEMFNEEALNNSESDDMDLDRYHTTTGGFFEMLERNEHLPLEDFKARAMKEMAAAAAAEQDREKKAQVEVGGSRSWTTRDFDTKFTEFCLPKEQLMGRGGVTGQLAGIAPKKQVMALVLEYQRRKRLFRREIRGLMKEKWEVRRALGGLSLEMAQKEKEPRRLEAEAEAETETETGSSGSNVTKMDDGLIMDDEIKKLDILEERIKTLVTARGALRDSYAETKGKILDSARAQAATAVEKNAFIKKRIENREKRKRKEITDGGDDRSNNR